VTDAVVVAAARTPIGKRGRALAEVRPDDLCAALVRSLLGRLPAPVPLDDVIVGCATPVGEQGWNIGRQVALLAGLPAEVPAVTVNRMCGSSDQAIQFASQAIRSGDAEAVLACGVESMSRVPMASDGVKFSRRMAERVRLVQQGLSAEQVVQKYHLSREAMDEYSLMSHQRAVEACQVLSREIIPVDLPEGRLSADEGPRSDTSLERLAGLAPAFQPEGRITAGNSSQMNDGAAAVLLTSRGLAERLGLPIRGRIVRAVSVGSDPVLQLTGPMTATQKVLAKAGLRLADIDHFEINEAFACVPMAWRHETEVPLARLNPRGGGISIGHPLGATGARLLVTMLHALEDTGGRYGLQSMCIGHGMANATILERL
jgi:acetyl-CoA acetyltransferase family protein